VFLNVEDWVTDQDTIDGYNVINTRIGLGHSTIVYGYDIMTNGNTFYRTHLGYINDSSSNVMMLAKNNIEGFVIVAKQNNNNCSTAYVYKDKTTGEESTYCPKCANLLIKGIHVNCRDASYDANSYLDENGSVTYEINIDCYARYDLSIDSNDLLDMALYDENNLLIEDGNYIRHSDNQHEHFIVKDLSKGKYYLKVSFYNKQNSGTIHTTIKPKNSTNIEDISLKSEVDVLPHLHNNHNVFRLYYRLSMKIIKILPNYLKKQRIMW